MGSVLFGIGTLSVLGTTFGLGVMAGRYWRPSWAPAPAQARPEAEATPAARGPDGPRVTFYGELPASPAPAVVTGAAPAPPPAAPSRPAATPVPVAAPRVAHAPAPAPAAAEPHGRFSIQVGAFRDRVQAVALRDRLAAAGDDAYLVEPEGAGAPWRVRVGAYGSREAAARAAERLAVERRLPTFVTAR